MKEKGLTKDSYFTFVLDGNFFSLPVESVKEVFNFSSLTPVPNALPYLRGVMNIRGSVVTILDLRILFGFQASNDLSNASIIVTEIKHDDGKTVVLGIIADSVDQVNKLQLVPFSSADSGSIGAGKEFVSGAARRDGKFILLLDLAKIFDSIEKDISVPARQ